MSILLFHVFIIFRFIQKTSLQIIIQIQILQMFFWIQKALLHDKANTQNSEQNIYKSGGVYLELKQPDDRLWYSRVLYKVRIRTGTYKLCPCEIQLVTVLVSVKNQNAKLLNIFIQKLRNLLYLSTLYIEALGFFIVFV